MAGNQREMERRERREQREKKHKLIIWAIIAVIILVLVIMKICEINVNSIKNHFTDANGDFTLTEGVAEDNFPYSIDASQNVTMINANNRIGVLTPNSYTVLDGKDASADYFFEHGYSNPVLASSGIYSLIYDQGAKKYRLDTLSQSVYEEEMPTSILCADVSKNGTVAIASTSKEKLCDITVISKALKEEWKLSISGGYIVDIALNDSSRELAVAVVSSENAELVTTVYTYSIGADGSLAEIRLPSGVLADIKYASNNIWAVGDSYLGIIKGDEYVECYAAGAISTNCYDYNQSGDVVLAYGNYSNSSECTVSYVKSNGKIKNEFNVSSNVKDISASSALVTVLTSNDIVSYNIKNGEEKQRVSTSESVKSICRIGSSVFVHRQSVIDRSEGADD